MTFSVSVPQWPLEGRIPARFAFGKPGEEGPFALSDNISPSIRWSEPPDGTRSFALIVHDPDVPSVGEDVNQTGKWVAADLARVDFFHWVVVDLVSTLRGLEEGAGSRGVVARGKAPGEHSFGRSGRNSYTDWFAGDADMEGVYGNYDGPCPPWNDKLLHRYYVTIYALDVLRLPVEGTFDGPEVLNAMRGHVLAEATFMSTYAMNPEV